MPKKQHSFTQQNTLAEVPEKKTVVVEASEPEVCE
jgi:hypothetical protein